MNHHRDTIRIDNPEVLEPAYPSKEAMLLKLIENPSQLARQLNLTSEQALNVRSLVTGAGTAAAVKYLSDSIGTELAGAIGGFLTGFLAKRLFGG